MSDQNNETDQDGSLGKELRHWGREALSDLADGIRTGLLFAAVMVPCAVIGYLIGDGEGLLIGLVAGFVLTWAGIIVIGVTQRVSSLRRRNSRDRS